MKLKKLWFVLLPIIYLTAAILFGYFRGNENRALASGFTSWTPVELARIHEALGPLPLVNNGWFASAGECAKCHGHDPNGTAMVTSTGRDVNPVDDWRATMMANAAKDPFWRAQVSHEGISAPAHKELFENECTTCHAPAGRFSHAFKNPGQYYTIADLDNDSLGLDGVTCVACHAQRPDSLGVEFSGHLKMDTSKVIYGPYPGPYGGPMADSIGVFPAYGPHVQDAQLCATCHTLITPTLDLQGNFTGGSFVEQATYHEWVNSDYSQNGETCQSCHMPELQDYVLISSGYDQVINPRYPYGLHELVGANVFMLRILKNNIDTLDLTADSIQFDSVLARTEKMLKQKSLDLSLDLQARTSDTAFCSLRLENKAGHKFPSGYPSRRAFVEFVLRDDQGDTLFKSGLLGGDYEVEGQDVGFEPHYDLITTSDQVQIYEFIMGDVNGDVTTTLTRADVHLKDNRLAPRGFSFSHSNYDTVEVTGAAVTDTSFNRDNGVEGSGADILNYHVPLNGYTGTLQVSARVYYQTVRPGWMDETFADSSDAINQFRDMFNVADKSPVLVAEVVDNDLLIGRDLPGHGQVRLWPNPSMENYVFVELGRGEAEEIRVYDGLGKLLWAQAALGQKLHQVQLGSVAGIYWVEVLGNGKRTVKKVIRL